MLSGQPPFHTDSYLETAFQHVRSRLPSLHALCPEVPLALELVIHQALKRDPGQRFQSPRDLASACMRVLTRRPFSIVTMARTQSGVQAGETAASGQGTTGTQNTPARAGNAASFLRGGGRRGREPRVGGNAANSHVAAGTALGPGEAESGCRSIGRAQDHQAGTSRKWRQGRARTCPRRHKRGADRGTLHRPGGNASPIIRRGAWRAYARTGTRACPLPEGSVHFARELKTRFLSSCRSQPRRPRCGGGADSITCFHTAKTFAERAERRRRTDRDG